MKKILMVLLVTCAFADAVLGDRTFDLTVVNKTHDIGSRAGCKLEFMPTLSSFINIPKAKVNNVMPGGEEKIHLELKPHIGLLQSADIKYIVRCEGFDAKLNITVAGNKYYADMSLDNKLSFAGSTGSIVNDKSIEAPLSKFHSVHKLIVKQK